jgi:hypothetical protein
MGYSFVGIGILVLFAALAIGTNAYNAVSAIPKNPNTGEQLGQAAFLAAFTPYGVASGFLMLLGVVFMYVGTSKKPNDVSVSQTVNVSTPYENEPPPAQVEVTSPCVVEKSPSRPLDESMLPLPQQGICPSCYYPIVFIEKYQRWYCVNERKYIARGGT